MANIINAEAGPSTPPPEVTTAYEKWHKKDGPPVGSTLGARYLTDDQDPFDHNAWDHVELPDDFVERATEITDVHAANPVKSELRVDYNGRPAHYWNKFYSQHQHGFFKNRTWLRLEFPELVARTEANAGPQTILEVGCGAGNTAFPLLMHNENPDLTIWATDYSSTAVDVVKANSLYPRPPNGKGVLHAAVWDITSRSEDPERTYSLPEGVEPGSVDAITVIYVLSALHPDEWDQAIHNLYTALKPGGTLFIRDYARHDLAQLRIKKDRLLDPSLPGLYIRGDGTRVYFFKKTEMEDLITAPPRGTEEGGAMFEIEQSDEDRRLLVNRKERLKMYRIWLQLKAKKIA